MHVNCYTATYRFDMHALGMSILPYSTIHHKTISKASLQSHLPHLYLVAELQEEEPKTAHPMSFTWASHTAASVLTGC